MSAMFLLHDLIARAAERAPHDLALIQAQTQERASIDYAQLDGHIRGVAASFSDLGILRGERIAVWMEKRHEFVTSVFAATRAGGVFVPINPQLKAAQVEHILRDCSVSMLVTTAARRSLLDEVLPRCASIRKVIVVDEHDGRDWDGMCNASERTLPRVIDADLAGIFYTSGSTGHPKGVMVSHRNLVLGAQSVADYLDNHSEDRLLAALPLSFDAGFSQLTTAFHAGASVVLLNYLLPRDVLRTMEKEHITGLTAVPPLWIQLASQSWPEQAAGSLRYFANTGGRMPRETLRALRERAPHAKPFLMYGLTEAFRATYLPPEQVERRPDSIGHAIPNAEVMVLREDGSECAVDEPGELVQRGGLVTLGYWNDAQKTAERYRPLPSQEGRTTPEIAVYSGDTVRRDAEGFLYFIGRRDEMIKTSGYRVSPTEIEEACYATQLVGEVVAVAAEHPTLGQAIVLIATPASGIALSLEKIVDAMRPRVPAWMLPSHLDIRETALPRNPNGKIDRKLLADSLTGVFTGEAE